MRSPRLRLRDPHAQAYDPAQAFPSGEGGRAQRGRMRSPRRRLRELPTPMPRRTIPPILPLRGRWPSTARSDEVVPSAAFGFCRVRFTIPWIRLTRRFHRGMRSIPPGNSLGFKGDAGLPRHPRAGAIAAPAPAQGVSPLDPFPLARFLGVVFPVSPGGGGRRTAAADTSPRPPAAGAWDPPPTQRTAPPPAPVCAPASGKCGCDLPCSPGSL